MNTKKNSLLKLLESLLDDHHSNCGDSRGRDGESCMNRHKNNDPFCECYDCTFGKCDAYSLNMPFKHFPDDKLKEIFHNQIPLEELSKNDKILLMNDMHRSMEEADSELKDYADTNSMTDL